MRADDVVGIDLEFRLRIDLGLARQQQGARHLLAVGLLRIRRDMNLALIDTARTVIQNAADDLVGGAFGHRVIHEGGDVLMLRTATHVDRRKLAVGTLSQQRHMRLQPCQRAARAQAEAGNRRCLGKRHTGGGKMRRIRAFSLDLDLLKPRLRPDIDPDQRG